ncbi:isochorismate synthase [Rhodococcus sp. HNM0569]|uniref:isochorismate synthase n=1 Tax=Rhodococcus sp. HNM0569 TaxID=2716340 RepID=UPI00146A5C21|nr:isochorismate synthase [Rhodococcus sp. HNM0569]NLU84585.1 isochorismate synthase [Rhodococcus sp. HNM0569]
MTDSASDAPCFVLSRPHGCIEARGVRTRFTSASDAAAAIRRGDVVGLVGALPFDPAGPCELFEPERRSRTASPRQATASRAVPAADAEEVPAAEHAARVERALGRIAEGELEKLVLARRADIRADAPLDPVAVLDRLVAADRGRNGYLVELGEPGAARAVLVGSSPEVLVRRDGPVVSCHPLAGSAPRSADPDEDRATADALLASDKDRREHAFVVEALRERLAPLCDSLEIPDCPELTSTPEMWHLGTPVTGVLADTATTALDLAIALHPTPAVCGTPHARALEVLRAEEPDRGFYAGTVGWCDANGDGEWMVAIRCAVVSADRTRAVAYAGGGIVAGSDPAAEVGETDAKFGTIFGALGVRAVAGR